MADDLFTSAEVCALSGASYRQLDWWTRCGVIRPEIDARGSGTQRRFAAHQVRIVRAITVLAALGAGHPVLTEVVRTLEARPELFARHLIVAADGVVSQLGDGPLPNGWVVALADLAEVAGPKLPSAAFAG